MKYRTEQALELLKRSHKVKLTIDNHVYKGLGLEKHVNELKKDPDVQIEKVQVKGEIKITVEIT